MKLACAPLLAALAVLAGCGGHSSASAAAPCIITVAGNKLCGNDALTWCKGDAPRGPVGTAEGGVITDPSTADACYKIMLWAHAPDGVVSYVTGGGKGGKPCYLEAPNASAIGCISPQEPGASPSAAGG